MLKIAYIVSSCSSGGAELLVKRLCEAIAEEDIRIQIWVMCRARDSVPDCPKEILDFEAAYISDLQKRNVEVLFLEKRKNKDRFKCCLSIRKYYRAFRPDIVHAHSEICSFYATLALTGMKCRLIQTIHSSKIFHPVLIKRYLARRINTFVSISDEATVSMLQAGIPGEKITLVNNGIDLLLYNYPERKFDRKPVKLIAVGRLELEKDYPFLLRSFRKAIERLSAEYNERQLPMLDIIGTGSKKAELKSLIEHMKLNSYVHLCGLRNDIPEQLKVADLYVMSSSFEGLSLALIEAAASGLPIIATDVGSNRKIVHPGINGLLVEYGNVEKFAQAIIMLVKDAVLREKYSHNSKKIADLFDIKKTVEAHLQLYRANEE